MVHLSIGNTDDREPLRDRRYLQGIKGKLCGDRGYIGRALFELLFINGIQLVTRVRNNMRNMLMSAEDKILLRKRAVIETVNDELKNIAQIEHSRHRSFNNFIVNILYCPLSPHTASSPKNRLSMSHLSMTNNLSFSDAYLELTLYYYALLNYTQKEYLLSTCFNSCQAIIIFIFY